MPNKILVAIADYAQDEHVFNDAIQLAKSKGKETKLLLLNILPKEASQEKAAKDTLQVRAEEAKALGINVELKHIDFGHPGSAICKHASIEEWGADCIVVGHRGRATWSKTSLGSVSSYVVEHAPNGCSVFVVRPPVKILVAMGSFEEDKYVFEHAKSLAEHLNASMILLHILSAQDERDLINTEDSQPIVLEELALLAHKTRDCAGVPTVFDYRPRGIPEGSESRFLEELRMLANKTNERGVPTKFAYRPGSTAEGISEYARAWNVKLIVVGKHQHRRLLGDISQQIINNSCCSVMVVHPPEKAERASE